MGKTFGAAKGEVAKCAAALRWFAEHAEHLLADETVATTASQSGVRYGPMGPVLAVMPWNFPMWQVMRFAAPALMAGNVGLLKHASNVPQTALLIEDVFRRAGFPAGAFQTLLVPSSGVAALIGDDRVRAVTLTGSEGAGRSVAEAAGRAIKKSVLELGGSDPFVVLPSADLDRAVAVGVQARVQNNGQSCIAAKRFIVHGAVLRRLRGGVRGRRWPTWSSVTPWSRVPRSGRWRRPRAATTSTARSKTPGPMARRCCAVGSGSTAPAGSTVPPSWPASRRPCGWTPRRCSAPVALLYRAEDAADALRMANDTDVRPRGERLDRTDADERELFVDGLDVGMVFVNAMVASTLELPFGGTKRSGLRPGAVDAGDPGVLRGQDGVGGLRASTASTSPVPSAARGSRRLR